MTATQIQGEPRFLVSSDSRVEMMHIVDLLWQEEPWNKPVVKCSCEASMARGRCCRHMLFLAGELLERMK